MCQGRVRGHHTPISTRVGPPSAPRTRSEQRHQLEEQEHSTRGNFKKSLLLLNFYKQTLGLILRHLSPGMQQDSKTS